MADFRRAIPMTMWRLLTAPLIRLSLRISKTRFSSADLSLPDGGIHLVTLIPDVLLAEPDRVSGIHGRSDRRGERGPIR
jgi:hypothetical protein